MIKKIYLKIDKRLEYYYTMNILRTNGIFLFHQNILLDIENNLNLNMLFLDKNNIWKFLKKKLIKKFIDNKFFYTIKNFKNILILKNIFDLNIIEKLLIENNNLILGYYLNNVFFFKEDWDIKKIDKKLLLEKIKKKIGLEYYLKKNILLYLKIWLTKNILILKKKNGNNKSNL